MTEPITRAYKRFPLARRIEHLVMLLSFTTLALTGLPQKFPAASLSIAFVYILGGIENLRKIHHFAAIVMMLGTAWHILVFGYMGYVRRTRFTMLPSLQDVKDGWQAFMYNIGRAKTPPQMGRYTFEEKMEYWAFVWGTIIMGATGFMMWNPISTVKFLPGEVIPAAKAAHGGEEYGRPQVVGHGEIWGWGDASHGEESSSNRRSCKPRGGNARRSSHRDEAGN